MSDDTIIIDKTPNQVVKNPDIRFWATIVLSSVATLIGLTITIDLALDEIDLAKWTDLASMCILYLASAYNLSVAIPNIPSRYISRK